MAAIKDERLAAWCEAHHVEGVVLQRRGNISWVTDGADVHVDSGKETGVARVVWTPKRKVVLTDNIETMRLATEEFGDEWDLVDRDWWEAAPPLPSGRYASDMPDDCIAELRCSLTDLEVERARTLGAESAEVVCCVMRSVASGMREHELAGEIVGGLRKRGIFCPVMLVGSDERIARYRHPIPTEKMIERCVMAAICAQRHGLIVSLTRLVHFGPLSGTLRARHDAVCRVDAALRAGTVPGRRWCEVLADGVRMYEETGFANEWTKHHQGGPMGYEARDFKATPTEERTVQESQLVGWNPSITGTKSEDTIISSTREIITGTDNWPMTSHGRPDILCRA
ncbi:MAG: M24 family metallopeptidase [Planctomycetes bacterium]|nr:M24 family metallopeptidase [Planctomycetota bacterium]NOG53445.1 M24 family metallopeptidase [Planctomycetota bacterium]